MTIRFSDNALSKLAADIDASATIITVEAGKGALYPSVTGTDADFFVITLEDSSGNREFVRVDHRSTDQFGDATYPCTRGYWGSTKYSFSSSDTVVDLRWSSNAITELFGSYVQKSGDTMTGPLTLPADPTNSLEASTKQYVDSKASAEASAAITAHEAGGSHDTRYVLKAGDTMTGALTLSGDPTTSLHAATKQYVDKRLTTDTIDPAPTDDTYDVGTVWVNTSDDTEWVCTDNTTGAAKWVRRGGDLLAVTLYSTAGTATHVWNTKTRYAVVEVWGGGGGGGGSVATAAGENAEGAGGGGGGYGLKKVDYSDLTASEKSSGVTVTVGSGGTGGAAGNNNGSDGATSSYGSHVSATGGSGGAYGANASGNSSSAGGSGGAGASGDLNITGGYGGRGRVVNGDRLFTGYGGESPRGGGRVGITSNSNGLQGNFPGGGGSGANAGTSSTAKAGGDGASGAVLVWEYS